MINAFFASELLSGVYALNSYNEKPYAGLHTMETDKPYEPDSTTLEKDIRQQFRKDEDVLCLNNKDGCFYLGTIVEVDVIYKKCLVEFLDNTKTWASFKDLKSFSTQESDVCYVCKKSQSKSDNKIVLCQCGRGCHQQCHEPKIPSSTADWRCKMCVPASKRREEKKRLGPALPQGDPVMADGPPTALSQLPYNPDTLTWDAHHRMNQEGQYCYCGGDGSWNSDMLQCRRCRQWFHARCAPSVEGPVLCGDRFYVFLCSLCNRGKEFSRRLALKWPDLVHLVLYNLTLLHQTKYYDLEESIMPFINKHWDHLKLPPWMAKSSVDERRGQVMDALITCEKRFKCGREIKKRANIWGLRCRGAPKAPPLSLPQRGPIDDKVLRMYCKKNMVSEWGEYKPLQNGHINSSNTAIRLSEDKAQHKLVPPLLINVPKPYSTSAGCRLEQPSRGTARDDQTTDCKVISSTEYHGRGLVKRSTPFPAPEPASAIDTRFRSHAVRKARRLLNKTMKRKKKTAAHQQTESVPPPRPPVKDFSQSFEEFVENRKRRMEIRTRSKESPEVRKRPQRNLLEARLNSTESKLYNPQGEQPEKSEKRGPRGPRGRTDPKHARPKLVQKTILDAFNCKYDRMKLELVPVLDKCRASSGESKSNSVKSDRGRRSGGSEDPAPGDSDVLGYSTDDDASSRGTLEPFIPTPKDFEGQNNPFCTVAELINTAAGGGGAVPAGAPPITLPLPLKTVIRHADPPRLKKRQLSEKDIMVDRNGQVKRRRRHRRTQASMLAAKAMAAGSAAKSAQITPSKSGKKALEPLAELGPNSRQLRAREQPKPADKPLAKSTPVKQSPSKEQGSTTEDLESSVKYFFGAASRIASGEKYEVRAKRVTSDGKLQCIIEWKCLPT